MSVVRSSVIASAKYSCSGSLDRFVKGKTTIDKRGAAAGAAAFASGGAVALVEGTVGDDHSHHSPAATIRMPARSTIAIGRRKSRGAAGGGGRAATGVSALGVLAM